MFVREQLAAPTPRTRIAQPPSVVIVGGGAAGLAAADMLRREGYDGSIAMVSADTDPPVDRPNLSKDYLAGEAQDDWIPLWPDDLYAERHIDLVLSTQAVQMEPKMRTVLLADGTRREYGALLIATGAEPNRLQVPGADTADVRYLRTFADSRAIVERAGSSKHVVVVGASFIGLEVAASLRTRGVSVTVVAPDSRPLARVMGDELGRFIQGMHEAHGVVFHLGDTVASMAGRRVTLGSGATIDADLVVVGIGVRPSVSLAERRALPWTTVLSSTSFLKRAHRASSPPAMWPVGQIRGPGRTFALNTGSWRSVRARPQPGTCSAGGSASTPCRFSGASTTT